MKRTTRNAAAIFLLLTLLSYDVFAFCGFYVAKADGTLKNKTSQVILVRDGNRTVVTMYSDFKGNLKDFAMVVPVPVLLKEKDIKVVDQRIFDVLNEYSKPRLVEYYDQNPCARYENKDLSAAAPSRALNEVVVLGYGTKSKRDLGVRIEAKYLVGEYDILILSARESEGLKTWLTENDYKIPVGAEEVLDPYIRDNMKFFVVKVNEKQKKKFPGNFLRPIQISFKSQKFMLPIRLGMANADGDQDMIVYALARKGRIESTNYRTVSLPTGKNIPLFVQQNFGAFYGNLFGHQWKKEGKSIAMLEYAWNVSPQNYVKCDPCVGNPPVAQDLVQAGVWWLNRDWNDYSDVTSDDDVIYGNEVYFTRLHVRYNRNSFPQDLVFQVTTNRENYQARYIITHPATGDFSCEEGRKYLKKLKERRRDELAQLTWLTGTTYENWDMAYEENPEIKITDASYVGLAMLSSGDDDHRFPGSAWPMIAIAFTGLLVRLVHNKKRLPAPRA